MSIHYAVEHGMIHEFVIDLSSKGFFDEDFKTRKEFANCYGIVIKKIMIEKHKPINQLIPYHSLIDFGIISEKKGRKSSRRKQIGIDICLYFSFSEKTFDCNPSGVKVNLLKKKRLSIF